MILQHIIIGISLVIAIYFLYKKFSQSTRGNCSSGNCHCGNKDEKKKYKKAGK